jgi:ribosomal protein L9
LLNLIGEIKQVARGDARNYLLPRKMCVYATPENRLEIPEPAAESVASREFKLALDNAKKRISKMKVQVFRKDANGAAAKEVSVQDVREKLFKQHKILLSEEQILLSTPIKKFGESLIQIKFQNAELPLRVNVSKR